MNAEEYIKERVDDQYNWLEKKSAFNQKRFKRLKVIVIVFSISIPFLTGLMQEGADWFDYLKLVIGGLGVGIAICEGLLALHKYQDHWINYRATAEALKREKLLFLTKTGRYEGNEATNFKHFVASVESILKDENAKWIEYIGKEEGEQNA